MDGGSVDRALERIEAALERIERATARLDADADALRVRHEDLKAAVSHSLSQLDKLLAGVRR
jgi:prefoldin subunit 5